MPVPPTRRGHGSRSLFVAVGEHAIGFWWLARWGLALVVLGQHPVAAMAGGMLALEGVAGGLELLLDSIRVGLAAVQEA